MARVTLSEKRIIEIHAQKAHKTVGKYVRDRCLKNRDSSIGDRRVTQALYLVNDRLNKEENEQWIAYLKSIKSVLNGNKHPTY
ncbi:MAG: hypothetical protein RLO81_09665 [Fulvivirga sp.]|uniref:plasmid mobilization protein n=1 Tax=Fulvivirga sp. TaxID=1931237 RepID=UPI0032ED44B6